MVINEWLDVLGCPKCQGGLNIKEDENLYCPKCDLLFPIHNDIPSMLSASEEKFLNELGIKYRELRSRQGWKPMSPEQMLKITLWLPAGL